MSTPKDHRSGRIWHQRRLSLFPAVLAASACLLPLSIPDAGRVTNAPRYGLTLERLLLCSSNELSRLDIAAMNLACTEGLPGTEGLDLLACLATLNSWAERVRLETERHFYRFNRNPTEFEGSEAYFRMLVMASTLCGDFGIHYNPERMTADLEGARNDGFFANSQDLFLHGLCGQNRTGTCSSMPVLYVAIGRRLGYPLRLVTTRSHVFLRWDGNGERFNLEATGRGMNRYEDAHYRSWPVPVTEEEVRVEGYLRSLSPAEELALFLSLRGNCLREAHRDPEALWAYSAACRLVPGSQIYRILCAEMRQSVYRQAVLPPAAYPDVQRLNAGSIAPDEPNPLAQVRLPGY